MVNDARDGDVITLEPGEYAGGIDFRGKGITLTSTNPRDPSVVESTIVHTQPTEWGGLGVQFVSGEGHDSRIVGLTITGRGYGVFISRGSSPSVVQCIIRDTGAELGGAVYVSRGSSPLIAQNILLRNSAVLGSAVYVENSSPIVRNNVISDGSGCPVYVSGGSPIIIANCIRKNSIPYSGHLGAVEDAAITLLKSRSRVEDNSVVDNDGAGILMGDDASDPVQGNIVNGNSGWGIVVDITPKTGWAPAIGANVVRGNHLGDNTFADQKTRRISICLPSTSRWDERAWDLRIADIIPLNSNQIAEVIAELRFGDTLLLERDPGAFLDPHAIRVVDSYGRILGHLPSSAASGLARVFREGRARYAYAMDIKHMPGSLPSCQVGIITGVQRQGTECSSCLDETAQCEQDCGPVAYPCDFAGEEDRDLYYDDDYRSCGGVSAPWDSCDADPDMCCGYDH
jgi:hypothetical protein